MRSCPLVVPRIGRIYRVAIKVTHYQQIMNKSYYIILKPANQIRFIHQIKVSIK